MKFINLNSNITISDDYFLNLIKIKNLNFLKDNIIKNTLKKL